jgi:ankyrin repeat protein
MLEDLMLPKPSMTKVIRATYRFSSINGQQSVEALKHLLAESADIEAADESGWTPLMYAAHVDSYENAAIRLLLQAHANVNRASLHGDTALMVAAYGGTLNELLLRAGADINAHNADGVTALMLLAQWKDPDALQDAIAAGASALAKDNADHIALDYLRASACGKPIIALPEPYSQVVLIDGARPSCPPQGDAFLKSRDVLVSAMKREAAAKR